MIIFNGRVSDKKGTVNTAMDIKAKFCILILVKNQADSGTSGCNAGGVYVVESNTHILIGDFGSLF